MSKWKGTSGRRKARDLDAIADQLDQVSRNLRLADQLDASASELRALAERLGALSAALDEEGKAP